MQLEGFEVQETLQRSSGSVTFRASRGGESFLVRLIDSPLPTVRELSQIRHEYEIARELSFGGILTPISIERTRRGSDLHVPVLLYQDFLGESLRDWIDRRLAETGHGSAFRPDIRAVLQVAINLAKCLAELNKRGIIHKDLTPQTILLDPKSLDVKLLDFRVATKLESESAIAAMPGKLEGTLAYISPEQTGRMNRLVDYRSDYYSFGVILYEMLTGAVPFSALDPMELVHSHIARRPIPPAELIGVVPQTVSNIAVKLLEKTAEQRYQSAEGILFDLEQCFAAYERTGVVEAFAVGQHDSHGKFQLLQKLYGRDDEVARLHEAFERAAAGSAELVLVGGQSGVGKTALVSELHKPVVRSRGFFVSGKFDQSRSDTPYASLIDALGELLDQVLSTSEHDLAHWREELLQALGQNGRVIADVIPDIELIIGPQPRVQTLAPAETRNRFNLVFKSFLRVFATREHPLVLFLDDVQWADAGSMSLLQFILSDPDLRHLCVIAAYRDNEVTPYHSVMMMSNDLRTSHCRVTQITIGNLTGDSVTEMVADLLSVDRKKAVGLSELLLAKTHGNAFFVREYLRSLHTKGELTFDAIRREWSWDEHAIRALTISENVVELLTSRFHTLPEDTRRMLEIASCIGTVFDFDTVHIVVRERNLDATAQTISQWLWRAVQEGFIAPLGDSYKQLGLLDVEMISTGGLAISQKIEYRFLHDRIRQSVAQSMNEADVRATHLIIGRRFLARAKETDSAEYLFTSLAHLNVAVPLITDRAERRALAEHNRRAGERALATTAYEAARTYFQKALELLPRDSWTSEYDLAFPLHLSLGIAEYLNRNLEESERIFGAATQHANTPLDKGAVYAAMVLLYLNLNKPDETIALGIEGLKVLGVDLKPKPGKAEVTLTILKAQIKLRRKTMTQLLEAPPMQDEAAKKSVELLMNFTTSAYNYSQELITMVILRMLEQTLAHGNSDISPYAFGMFGLIAGSGFGNYMRGYEFGKLSLDLCERFNNQLITGRCNLLMGGTVSHWREHARENIAYLNRTLQCATQSGDFLFVCHAMNLLTMTYVSLGEPLETVLDKASEYTDFVSKIRYEHMLVYHTIARHFALCLQGQTLSIETFATAERSEEALHEILSDAQYKAAHMWYLILRMQTLYLAKNFDAALAIAKEAEKEVFTTIGQLIAGEYHFYYALILLAKAKESGSKRVSGLAKHVKKLRKWSANAPMNFRHKLLLVEAMWNDVKGNTLKAETLYDEAIQNASEHGYKQVEALGHELAGEHYSRRNLAAPATAHLLRARDQYARWGATAKIRLIEERHAPLLRDEAVMRAAEGIISRSAGAANTFDLQTLVKASQALSGELVLSKLLEKMMQLMLEHTGAERGLLVLARDGRLVVETEATTNPSKVSILDAEPLEASDLLSKQVVQYVNRTHESLVLVDATTDNRYSQDPYILAHKPRSVMAVPIVASGKLLGILYLENNLVTNAFTAERLDLLEMLSKQAAVSLENALLYRVMEERVDEATREVRAQKEEVERQKALVDEEMRKADDLLLNILPAEIAGELKREGKSKARHYPAVTVLFADIKDFTRIAATMHPDDVVRELDRSFRAFDAILARHGVEKIKTIGDAYMCAGGLPVESKSHALDVVRAAIDMRDVMDTINAAKRATGEPVFELRIGVHTGPVVAGIVGNKKFAYDIWGDTVNTAQRIEASGEAGKVSISGTTYEQIRDAFHCEKRGAVPLKNKGDVELYFVTGPR
jgi:histidine kinase